MKKILITGANSYIGTSFEAYMKQYSDKYQIDTVDMIGDSWKKFDFFGYDAVFHVAGIAHQKETKQNVHLYYKINRDLAVKTAKKAKAEGVKHFIFLSSMSIYGMDTGVIDRDTQPNPKSNYGKSKWQAEQKIASLEEEEFCVCILRPPMVYGKGCKGNFNNVCKLVKKLPVFPRVKNQRSMIYIDNLSSFVKMCIDNSLTGLYFPQNRNYVATMDMARGIALAMNKKIRFEYLMGWGVYILRLFYPMAKKGFGSLIYQDTDEFDYSYIVIENEQSFINSVV